MWRVNRLQDVQSGNVTRGNILYIDSVEAIVFPKDVF